MKPNDAMLLSQETGLKVRQRSKMKEVENNARKIEKIQKEKWTRKEEEEKLDLKCLRKRSGGSGSFRAATLWELTEPPET